MKIHCPTCSRSSDEAVFIGEFCEFCIAEKVKRKLPKEIAVHQCRFCNRVKVANTFFGGTDSTWGRALAEATGEECRVKALEREKNGTVKCRIICRYGGGKVAFDHDFKVRVAHETCQRCYRMSSGYYEGVVQLRGNRIKIERVQEKLKRFVERRGGYITRTDDVLNGVDLYVSDKEMANGFFAMTELKPERSFRLYGVRNGKKVYRNTYALHL
jgi:NMD protein affecting ribosome stability and mRNA decay